MSITEKDLQTFINKIGAKIQSMTDVSCNRISDLNKCVKKLKKLEDLALLFVRAKTNLL